METLLEQQRRYHEEKERLIDAMVKENMHSKKTPRDQINSDHRMRILLDRFQECTRELRDLYEDKDGQRKEEVQALSGPNEFAEFYIRLKSVREFYRKHPGEISVPMSVEFEELNKARENPTEDHHVMAEFTDEEGYGKYLDLHECYDMFINLKGQEKVDYLTYVTNFDRLFEVPKERKNTAYKQYLGLLLDYLEGYLGRVKPMLDMQEEMDFVRTEFERHWAEGTFPGWPKETSSAMAHSGAHLDLSAFSSPEELASLGLDRLKSALMALGLKCGGTLEERAARLFLTKGKRLNQLDQSLFAKAKQNKGAKDKEFERHRDTALLEAQLYRLVELLADQRTATRENVQRKQAQGSGEREGSDAEDRVESESDSDGDEDDIPYNPKNLPLGWDGKPIPYWLYKLHGLNLNYNCEICGNFTYRGPKAYQRHFAERRHAHGMKCLGIPNTAHFANVTAIEDAMALWEKIKTNKSFERWKPDADEEFEDSKGNVVSKKMYDDLARQGCL